MSYNNSVRAIALVLAACSCVGLAAGDAPDEFTFIERTGVATGVTVTSEARTVGGFEGTLPVSVVGGTNAQYRIGNGAFTSVAGSIGAGQALTVRHASADSASTTTVTTVSVGTYSTPFRSVTGTIDRTPDAFSFGTRNGTEPSSLVESEPTTPAGYDTGIALVAGPASSTASMAAHGPVPRAPSTRARH